MPPPGRDESSLPLLDTSFNQFTLSFSDEPTSDDDDTTPTATTRPNGASSSSYPPLRRPLPPSFHRSGSPERSRTSTGESIDTLLAPYSDDGGLVEVQELGRSRESSRSTSPLAGAGGRGIKSMIASRELEFDLDPDELPPSSPISSAGSDRTLHARQSSLQSPLLVGLLTRRSTDTATLPSGSGSSDPLEADLPDWLVKGGGMLSGIANMSNSIMGAGIIGLPYALRSAGFWTGMVLLVGLCLVTDWTIRLIVLNAKLSGRNSYIEIMGHCFGEHGRAGVSFFQFAFAFGGMCAFGVIIGDTIPHVIAFLLPFLRSIPVLSLLLNRSFVIILATVGVSYPLSLHRDISKLSKASGIALLGMLIIVLSVLIEGSRLADPALRGDPSARFTFIEPRIFEAIGVISFAFVCHHNSLLIYGSLQTPTLDRFAQVTHISTALSLIACLLMALSGFLVFSDKTQANILNNFPQDDILINIARLCFGLNMFTTLPLEAFVCREVIESYFYPSLPFCRKRHVIITTAVVFSAMIISLLTCDLGIVLELTGGLSATVLAFIFPAICFLKLSDAPTFSRTKLPAWACASFGMLVLILSLFLSLAKAFRGGGETLTCS